MAADGLEHRNGIGQDSAVIALDIKQGECDRRHEQGDEIERKGRPDGAIKDEPGRRAKGVKEKLAPLRFKHRGLLGSGGRPQCH